jgi:hypothetical protein
LLGQRKWRRLKESPSNQLASGTHGDPTSAAYIGPSFRGGNGTALSRFIDKGINEGAMLASRLLGLFADTRRILTTVLHLDDPQRAGTADRANPFQAVVEGAQTPTTKQRPRAPGDRAEITTRVENPSDSSPSGQRRKGYGCS